MGYNDGCFHRIISLPRDDRLNQRQVPLKREVVAPRISLTADHHTKQNRYKAHQVYCISDVDAKRPEAAKNRLSQPRMPVLHILSLSIAFHAAAIHQCPHQATILRC